jgi:hypothetical protein
MIPNHDSIDHEDRYVRDNYRYDVIIQIELSAINGLSAVSGEGACKLDSSKQILKRSNVCIASVFVQLIHEDHTK